jgi:hypothetical protein
MKMTEKGQLVPLQPDDIVKELAALEPVPALVNIRRELRKLERDGAARQVGDKRKNVRIFFYAKPLACRSVEAEPDDLLDQKNADLVDQPVYQMSASDIKQTHLQNALILPIRKVVVKTFKAFLREELNGRENLLDPLVYQNLVEEAAEQTILVVQSVYQKLNLLDQPVAPYKEVSRGISSSSIGETPTPETTTTTAEPAATLQEPENPAAPPAPVPTIQAAPAPTAPPKNPVEVKTATSDPLPAIAAEMRKYAPKTDPAAAKLCWLNARKKLSDITPAELCEVIAARGPVVGEKNRSVSNLTGYLLIAVDNAIDPAAITQARQASVAATAQARSREKERQAEYAELLRRPEPPPLKKCPRCHMVAFDPDTGRCTSRPCLKREGKL